jgi:Ankyrin repeats (3 copies)
MEMVDLLLDHEADPNQVESQTGLSPLLLAVQERHTSIVKLLLDRGALPYQASPTDGLSPLIHAMRLGDAHMVKMLVDCGVDSGTLHVEPQQSELKRPQEPWAKQDHFAEARENYHLGPSNLLSSDMAVPGRWVNFEPDAETLEEIDELLWQSEILLKEVSRSRLREIKLTKDAQIRLRHFRFYSTHGFVVCDAELLWLSVRGPRPPRSSELGFTFGRMLTDMKIDRSCLSADNIENCFQIAALALFFGHPVRFPLPSGLSLPRPHGAARINLPPDDWRPWRVSFHADGLLVELPWIEDEDLVRGQVIVPIDGSDVRVLPSLKFIARFIGWRVPLPIESGDGNWRAARFLWATSGIG